MTRGLGPREDQLLVYLLEGTSAVVGCDFFAALVHRLAAALDVAGAWVTEVSADRKRLSAHAFWFQDHYIPDYEYAIEGTPCEPVIENCSLFHVQENVIELFPRDPDLAALDAVSYLGLPLIAHDGSLLGHLAVLDVKPLHLDSRLEAILRIFAARASAEVERLRAERRARDREEQISALFDTVGEAILILSEDGRICNANHRCTAKFAIDLDRLRGKSFAELLCPDARDRFARVFAALTSCQVPRETLWVSSLDVCPADAAPFPADAGLSCFSQDTRKFCTVVLRDLREQRDTERLIAALTEQTRQLRQELEEVRPPGRLIGASAVMKRLFAQMRQVAATDATVLIQGESGTGKELVARAIHESSRRAGRPLVRVNCGAIPPSLIESEFFGHVKGAFTGATELREGRFALADGGTLFLDEVGELPLDLQVKLLRVLQEGEFEPVGSSRTRKVDVRIIAATNRDLGREVTDGRFRADLFYRLNVFPITVPPLRDRMEDIDLLADAILERLRARFCKPFAALSASCLERLRAYHWPGNVRELENVLERAAVLAAGNILRIDAALVPLPASPGIAENASRHFSHLPQQPARRRSQSLI
jgi:PAS domain S-box-containing protein